MQDAPRQARVIAAVQERCEADPRVLAALTYGSLPKGEGDRFSDVEFYVFVKDKELPLLDAAQWVAQVEPYLAFFSNEFGTQVAIFEDLLRAEFHFERHAAVSQIERWRPIEHTGSADDMLLLDRVGELTSLLQGIERQPLRAETLQSIYDRFLNWFLLGANVLQRGERARALDSLSYLHRALLQLARARDESLEHWATPSRNLEHELPKRDYERFCACTADLSAGALESAFREIWRWSQELVAALSARMDLDERGAIARKIDANLTRWFPR